MNAKVLIYASDSLLAETRCWVLEQAGFEVTLVTGLLQAVQALTTQEINLLILCHSLSQADCESAVAFSHQVRPRMRNLLLKNQFSPRDQRGNDAVCCAPFEPKELVQTVRTLTQAQEDSVFRFQTRRIMPGENLQTLERCQP